MNPWTESLWCPDCSAWTPHTSRIQSFFCVYKTLVIKLIQCTKCGREVESQE